ncbi:hypothetical protein [Flagellimonas flava]|uniref:Uncharacterized protein n=1 Tax=Flagellimonas flava TaxID=570519 RepID=A0A1M5KDU7_9FLAO|nr:hypothetical protein [Allomuricauda flava]SHG50881.1 hypothetical protein SAMN04488116_1522 [Allomuricauda flava]
MNTIYRTTYYTLYQATSDRCFYIDFGQKVVRISFCQLLAIRHKVLSISIEDHFDSEMNKHGLEVLQLCNKKHLFVLNTLEILDLKELMEQGFLHMGLSATPGVLSA